MQAILLGLLRAYKSLLSPVFLPACRYVPTCSEYAGEAIARHGTMYGSALAIWRLLRCHPFAKGGLDLVPIEGELGSSLTSARTDQYSHSHSAPRAITPHA